MIYKKKKTKKELTNFYVFGKNRGPGIVLSVNEPKPATPHQTSGDVDPVVLLRYESRGKLIFTEVKGKR